MTPINRFRVKNLYRPLYYNTLPPQTKVQSEERAEDDKENKVKIHVDANLMLRLLTRLYKKHT